MTYVKIKRSKHKPTIYIYGSFNIICPNVAGLVKKCFITTEKGTFKKKR